jgi:pRiA4b ORF-3-like protein
MPVGEHNRKLHGMRHYATRMSSSPPSDTTKPHDVVVEAILRAPLGLKFAVCVNGQNACPPADCSGAGGYSMMSRLSPIRHTRVTTSTRALGPVTRPQEERA